MEYEGRLLKAYSRFAGVYTQSEQINQYVQNLSPTVAFEVVRERQKAPRDYETLQSVMELADSFGQAIRAKQGGHRQPTRCVLTVEEEVTSTPSSSITTGRATPTSGEILAVDIYHRLSPPGRSSTPSYSTCTTDATPHSTVLITEWSSGTESQAQASSLNAPSALPVMNNRKQRLEAYAQPYRPGWQQSVPARQVQANTARSSQNKEEHLYFLYASADHYFPDCPFVTDDMRATARQNVMQATSERRRRLPRWTYQLA